MTRRAGWLAALVLAGCGDGGPAEAEPPAEAGPVVDVEVVERTNDVHHEVTGERCLAVAPVTLDMAGKWVGTETWLPVTITSCGDVAVTATVALSPDSDPKFSLATAEGSLDAPLVIDAGATATIQVRYEPAAPPSAEECLRDTATVVVQSNAEAAEVRIEVSGYGVEIDDCTVPAASVEEGEQVAPGTVLHLGTVESWGCCEWTSWRWSVDAKPEGSQGMFLPSNSAPNPTFLADVAGEYLFSLTGYGQHGRASVVPGTVRVVAVP